MLETWVRFLGQEDPLEKEMATHSSILAWKFPWTEEPAGYRSIGRKSQTQLSAIFVSFSMWNLPKLGIKPVFPALAGGFLSTVPPPGKS